MIRMTMSTIVFATLAATGCGAEPDQVITGRIKTSTFPEPVTMVRAIGTSTTASAAVPADGSFSIRLPADERYRIELVSVARRSSLVFPRITGAIDTTVFVETGGAALELGSVRYLRDPASRTFEFDGGAACEDGETASGSVCVGDTGTGTGGGQDTGTGGGQDTGTGGGQDPGGPKGEGDGAGDRPCGDGVGQPDGAGSVEGDAAVGDHNLPAEIGCSGDGDGDAGGGQDTGTGGGQDTGSGGGGG